MVRKMKMKNRSYRYDISRPGARYEQNILNIRSVLV